MLSHYMRRLGFWRMGIKPNAIYNLPTINDWQYQMALIASRSSLDLLTGDEIDWLMDCGYYDDVMLEVIHDDPIYPTANYSKLFKQIWQNLALPNINNHQAKLINTFDRLCPFVTRPHHITPLFDDRHSNNGDTFYDRFYDFYFGIDDDIYIDTENFSSLLYSINDYIYGYENYGLNQSILFSAIHEFLIECENWLTLHKNDIIAIFNQFNKISDDCYL